MMNMELNEKIQQVANKEQLIADMRLAETDEEVKEVLSRHGLEITDELEALMGQDELNPEDLDMVAGGCKCRGWLKRLITGIFERIFGFECLDCA